MTDWQAKAHYWEERARKAEGVLLHTQIDLRRLETLGQIRCDRAHAESAALLDWLNACPRSACVAAKKAIDVAPRTKVFLAAMDVARLCAAEDLPISVLSDVAEALSVFRAAMASYADAIGTAYAEAMNAVNVGGDGSCPSCGSEPGCNIDCRECDGFDGGVGKET